MKQPINIIIVVGDVVSGSKFALSGRFERDVVLAGQINFAASPRAGAAGWLERLAAAWVWLAEAVPPVVSVALKLWPYALLLVVR